MKQIRKQPFRLTGGNAKTVKNALIHNAKGNLTPPMNLQKTKSDAPGVQVDPLVSALPRSWRE